MNANVKDSLTKRMNLVTAGFYGLTCVAVLLLATMCWFGPQMFFADPSLKTYLIFVIVALVVLAVLVFTSANIAIDKFNDIEEQISEIVEANAVEADSEPCVSEEIGQYNALSQKCEDIATGISIIMVVGSVFAAVALIGLVAMVLSM